MNKDKLNKKHKAFADNYLKDPERNARRAYKKVYPKTKDNAADAAASRLLKNVKVQTYIENIEDKVTENTGITNERILQEYARIAFLDPRKLFDEDGGLKNIQDMDEETVAAIGGMDIESLFEGRGKDREHIGYARKIKLVDKKGALDSLSKIKGMFIEKSEVLNLTFEEWLKKNQENLGEYGV